MLCKDGTPYSLKYILPNLHCLFLKLSEKIERDVRLTILKVFYKMALHQDAYSRVFLEVIILLNIARINSILIHYYSAFIQSYNIPIKFTRKDIWPRMLF